MRFPPQASRVLAAEAVEGASPSSSTTPGAGGMRSTAPASRMADGGGLDSGGRDAGEGALDGKALGPASKV